MIEQQAGLGPGFNLMRHGGCEFHNPCINLAGHLVYSFVLKDTVNTDAPQHAPRAAFGNRRERPVRTYAERHPAALGPQNVLRARDRLPILILNEEYIQRASLDEPGRVRIIQMDGEVTGAGDRLSNRNGKVTEPLKSSSRHVCLPWLRISTVIALE